MLETKPLYYFTSAEHALQAVERCRIKISFLDKVNDPYEFLAVKSSNRGNQAVLAKIREKLGTIVGFICFSEQYNNTMLWGHYSEKLSGICLGFDVQYDKYKQMTFHELMKSGNYRYLSEIKYMLNIEKKTYQNIQFDDKGGGSIPEKDLEDMLFTKSYHWKYEEEWRLLVRTPEPDPVNELYFLPFDRQVALRKIFIGPHCLNQENMKSRLGKLVLDYPHPPEIVFTDLSSSTFEIKIKKVT